eukprot:1193149-Prorocentrum_minimum.AAC.3
MWLYSNVKRKPPQTVVTSGKFTLPAGKTALGSGSGFGSGSGSGSGDLNLNLNLNLNLRI